MISIGPSLAEVKKKTKNKRKATSETTNQIISAPIQTNFQGLASEIETDPQKSRNLSKNRQKNPVKIPKILQESWNDPSRGIAVRKAIERRNWNLNFSKRGKYQKNPAGFQIF